MTKVDATIVVICLLVGTLLAISGGCAMNIGSGSAGTSFDRHTNFEEPILNINKENK